MPMPPRTARGVERPAGLSFDDLPAIVTTTEVADATRLDKKTVLRAIHGGEIPAWYPGGNTTLGFRMHKGDVEAWFFADPDRAHTAGTGDKRAPS